MKQSEKRKMKKVFDFAVCCVAVLAVVGGIGSLLYDRHYLFAVAVACLAAMAFPYVRERVKELLG